MSAARIPAHSDKTRDIEDVEERIRIRAYLLFEKRGGEHGRALDDWLQAEEEILRSKPSTPPVRWTPLKKSRTKRTSI